MPVFSTGTAPDSVAWPAWAGVWVPLATRIVTTAKPGVTAA
ncbi:MAG: hypothetical protein ACKO40_05145 [Planctomycetaceae bacterium]